MHLIPSKLGLFRLRNRCLMMVCGGVCGFGVPVLLSKPRLFMISGKAPHSSSAHAQGRCGASRKSGWKDERAEDLCTPPKQFSTTERAHLAGSHWLWRMFAIHVSCRLCTTHHLCDHRMRLLCERRVKEASHWKTCGTLPPP